jgi:predicted transglutaminase-like cysteine proteinase
VVRKEVYRIVDEVNSKFVYTRDTFGDDWTVPVPRNNTILADCDGYAAFIKEELLASKMFSEYCLRLALCKANPQTTTKIDHMVLLLLLEEGDRVIDNNNLYFIQDWRSYSYTWAYRETGTGALEEIIGS